MAAPRAMFRRLLIIIAAALIIPIYFVVSRLVKTPANSLRSRAFRPFKQMGHSPDFPLPDEHDSDSSIPSVGVILKAIRVHPDNMLTARRLEPETTPNKSRTINDHVFETSKGSRKTRSGFSSAPTKSPVKTLKEKYKNDNYRTSCKYLKTSKGLNRICVDRYTNGSQGKLTAKAVMTHKDYFAKKPVLQLAVTDTASIMVTKVSDTKHIKKHEPSNIKKAPVKHYRHRGVVASAPPKSKPSALGILDSTPWVSYIDPHDYRYLVNPGITTCMDHERVDLLVLVTSHPEHIERRDAIRDTWGAPYGSTSISPVVKVRFLLGVTTLGKQVIENDLQKEVDKHGDIIVEEFLESYLNLSVKTVMGLKWASRYCPDARYVMKTDDDIIINTPRLLAYLHTAPRRALITGRLAKNYPVLRDRREKFYVPKEVYSKETYPDYCVGLGYIISIDLVHKLYLQSLLTPLFPWEDVYVGIMLKDMGIIPKNINNFYFFPGRSIFEGETIVDPKKSLFRLRSYYTLDGLTPGQTKILWSQWQNMTKSS